MNVQRRRKIEKLIDRIGEIREELETIAEEEEEYRDNMPENLWGSSKYESSEEASSNLSDSMCNIDDLICSLESAIE